MVSPLVVDFLSNLINFRDIKVCFEIFSLIIEVLNCLPEDKGGKDSLQTIQVALWGVSPETKSS